jgi:hypothetical protein
MTLRKKTCKLEPRKEGPGGLSSLQDEEEKKMSFIICKVHSLIVSMGNVPN